MKLIILIALIYLSAVDSRPQSDKDAEIIKQESEIHPDGGYDFSYETQNGIKGEEKGTLKKASSADKNDAVIVAGTVSYTAPDGTKIVLSYTADDDQGFVPKGDHIPTPPPIPEAILKAIEFIKANPPKNK